MQRNIREVRIYDFIYQLLLEYTDSNWEYKRYDDMFAKGDILETTRKDPSLGTNV